MIYLDNHATTPCDPRVVEAMLPYFTEEYGNAGSLIHPFGEAAREAVERSRQTIAGAIGAAPEELVFTSGATESNNLAIRGVAERARRRGDHLVSVATEHKAVLDPLARLTQRGYRVTLLPVSPQGQPNAGRVDPQAVAEAITDDTCLVSVMLANNEIGVIQPLAEIANICRERGVLLHCDATQAVGKIPVDVRQLDVDLLSFTAHKLYGSKGIGALYVRGRDPIVRLDAQINGGGQQAGRRSGTLNVPGIVGFARAVDLCAESTAAERRRLTTLRNQLWRRLQTELPGIELVGPALDAVDSSGEPLRLPHNLNVSFGDVEGEAILLRTPTVAASSGAACSSSDPAPSHVLAALGLDEGQIRSSLRFGLGRFTTAEEIEQAADALIVSVRELRTLL